MAQEEAELKFFIECSQCRERLQAQFERADILKGELVFSAEPCERCIIEEADEDKKQLSNAEYKIADLEDEPIAAKDKIEELTEELDRANDEKALLQRAHDDALAEIQRLEAEKGLSEQ